MAPKYRAMVGKVSEDLRPRCMSSDDAYAAVRDLEDELQECFVVLALDARLRLIQRIEVGRGSLTTCAVHPRDVFRPLIKLSAASCILAHNHPSGDPEPSADDLAMTRRLVRAGTLLGVNIEDHIIVGRGYVSLASRGVVK